jgi:hypothetical protein
LKTNDSNSIIDYFKADALKIKNKVNLSSNVMNPSVTNNNNTINSIPAIVTLANAAEMRLMEASNSIQSAVTTTTTEHLTATGLFSESPINFARKTPPFSTTYSYGGGAGGMNGGGGFGRGMTTSPPVMFLNRGSHSISISTDCTDNEIYSQISNCPSGTNGCNNSIYETLNESGDSSRFYIHSEDAHLDMKTLSTDLSLSNDQFQLVTTTAATTATTTMSNKSNNIVSKPSMSLFSSLTPSNLLNSLKRSNQISNWDDDDDCSLKLNKKLTSSNGNESKSMIPPHSSTFSYLSGIDLFRSSETTNKNIIKNPEYVNNTKDTNTAISSSRKIKGNKSIGALGKPENTVGMMRSKKK